MKYGHNKGAAVLEIREAIEEAKRQGKWTSVRDLESLVGSYQSAVSPINKTMEEEAVRALELTWQEVQELDQAERDRLHRLIGNALEDFLREYMSAGLSWCAVIGPLSGPYVVQRSIVIGSSLTEEEMRELSVHNGRMVWVFTRSPV